MFAYSRLGFHPRTPRMPPAAPARSKARQKSSSMGCRIDRAAVALGTLVGNSSSSIYETSASRMDGNGGADGSKVLGPAQTTTQKAACLMGLCGSGPHGKETIRTSGIPIICPVGAETVPETDGPRRQLVHALAAPLKRSLSKHVRPSFFALSSAAAAAAVNNRKIGARVSR